MLTIVPKGKYYHVDYMRHAVRGSFGTRDRDVAIRLAHRLEIALVEGATSSLWSELMPVLPRESYLRLAKYIGVKVEVVATWEDLRKSYEDYLDNRVSISDFADKSVEGYKRAIRKFDEFLSGKPITLLRDITPAICDEYRFLRIKSIQAKKGPKGGSGYASEAGALHAVFQHGILRGLAPHNPFVSFRNRGSAERGAQPFEPEELLLLRQHAGTEYLIFVVLRWTGLRESDAATLRWREVNFAKGQIVKPTKKTRYKKSAVISMDEELIRVLKDEYDRRKPSLDELVLQHDKSHKSMTVTHLVYRIKRLATRAGIVDSSPHSYRDTFAVDMLLHDVPDLYVAAMLGDRVETVRSHYLPYVDALRQHARLRLKNGMKLEDLAVTQVAQ